MCDRVGTSKGSSSRSRKSTSYMVNLERKVQSLQEEASKLYEELTIVMIQKSELMATNNELRCLYQKVEQELESITEMNNALKEQIKLLKLLAGEEPFNYYISSPSREDEQDVESSP